MNESATQNRIIDTAHLWRERLSQPQLTAKEKREFYAWLRADHRHAQAYERAERLWGSLGTLQPEHYDSALRERSWREKLPALTWGAMSTQKAAGLAAAAVAVFTLGLLFLDGRFQGPSKPAEALSFSTPVGVVESHTLEDGTTVTLGPKSAVSVTFHEDSRDVTLIAGSALFDVTADSDRPLTVRAGVLSVRVVGTRFDVRRSSQVTRVAVAEGIVDVLFPTLIDGELSETLSGARIERGEQIAARRAAGLQETEQIRPEAVGAWRDNKLDYSKATLAELLEDVQRISDAAWVLDDPEGLLDEQTFSAFFDANDLESLLTMLPAILPVEISGDTNGGMVIRPRDP
ncbi:MAG: FecR domain-containing protein [Pseudomonadota bacterium]